MEGSSDVYCQSIKLLNESQFNSFVRLYVQCIYNADEVFISNGPYDGGRDLTIIVDGKEIKRNVQITVLKDGIKSKVLSDLQKAHKNVNNYGYLSKLDFYSKEEVSNEAQNQCRVISETQYGIEISFYDCRRLATMVETYPILRSYLKESVFSSFAINNEELDVNTGLVFDVLSQQTDIVDLKHAIVETCFISCLFRKGDASLQELIDSLDIIFCKNIKHSYYQNLSGVLIRQGVIEESTQMPGCYRLSSDTYEMYSLLEQQAQNCTVAIQNDVRDIIQKYNLIDVDEVSILSEMTRIYDFIYQGGISEIESENGIIKSDSQEFVQKTSFEAFLKSKGVPDRIISNVITDVFCTFESNSIFGRESASRTLIKLFNDNKIRSHRRSKIRTLILDTPVLIRWICLLFNKVKDYGDPFFQTVQRMKTVVEEMHDSIRIETMDGYIYETAVLLRKAIRLKRFEKIMRSLGSSKNVFFNYYLEADKTISYGDCEAFILECLDIDVLPTTDSEIDSLLFGVLKDRLSNVGIESIRVSQIDNQLELWRDYEFALVNTSGENKSELAKERDLQTIIHMANDFSQDDEPSLITSDASFSNVRDYLGERYDRFSNWLIYTPLNISRSLSLENFRINTSELTFSIRFAMESTIQNSPYGKSLVDVISEVTSSWRDRDMRFANQISRLRKALHSCSINGEQNQNAIDELLSFIIRHYSKQKDAEDILLLMFDDKEYSTPMKSVLKKYMYDFKENDTVLTSRLIEELDALINQVELVDD